jgi:hypothetical protein
MLLRFPKGLRGRKGYVDLYPWICILEMVDCNIHHNSSFPDWITRISYISAIPPGKYLVHATIFVSDPFPYIITTRYITSSGFVKWPVIRILLFPYSPSNVTSKFRPTFNSHLWYDPPGPPLWSSGQSPSATSFSVSTRPREYNWGATWMEK